MICKHCKKDGGHVQNCPVVSDRAFNNRMWAQDEIVAASMSGMYGKAVVYFEAGVPVRITIEESVKPPKFAGTPVGADV